MDLKNIFKACLGQKIKDPERLTCDTDQMAEHIDQTARDNGLTLAFCKPGQTKTSSPNLVIAHIEKIDGNPFWQVKDFTPS